MHNLWEENVYVSGSLSNALNNPQQQQQKRFALTKRFRSKPSITS